MSTPVIREVHANGWRICLDMSRQVLSLEIPRDDDPRTPLLRTLPPGDGGPVSAAMLLLKAKQFDDSLYASVDLAAQKGAGRFRGKDALLHSLAETLSSDAASADIAAVALVFAACELGELPVRVPSGLEGVVRPLVEKFLRNELLSKPLGVYTWTPELKAIFRQGRFLQQPLEATTAAAFIQLLDRISGAWDAYDSCLRLAARLTNSLRGIGLRDPGEDRAFFPASLSHEVILLERLYKGRLIPDGFNLMDELIRQVRAHQVNLEPTQESGWYDYQTWSLEPLLVPNRVPERIHLVLGSRYRRYMEDLFRGTLALMRETHIRQGGIGAGGCGRGPVEPPIRINLNLTVEPFPSVYARRAASYRFVRSVLEEAFGPEHLQELHRVTPEGPRKSNLTEELAWIEKLFEGATAAAREELGMEALANDEEAIRCFSEWGATVMSDADVSRDVRMMVPVFYDEERRKMKVWAFLGWRMVPVDVDFRSAPEILTVERLNPSERSTAMRPLVLFNGNSYRFPVPVMAEVYVEKLLDRDEFRRHCDRYRTRAAILANLR
jgi:hypothetical protein